MKKPIDDFNWAIKKKGLRKARCKSCLSVKKSAEWETGFRTCSDCGITKPLSEYYIRGTGIPYTLCKVCHRDDSTKRRVGVANISELLVGAKCEICKIELGPKTYAVDHDHACCSGKQACGKCFRGLLCLGCNTALGSFKDDVSRLEAAIVYLNSHRLITGT